MRNPFRRPPAQPTPPQQPVLCMPSFGIQLADGQSTTMWEIARPGVYHAFIGGRVELSSEDLRQIAAVYDPDYLAGAVNYDHQMFGPSHGWVRRLEFDGQRLLAEVSELSAELVQDIRTGRYRRVSPELKPIALQDGREVMYLRGLGVLGNRDPAIAGMQPIAAAAGQDVLLHLAAEASPSAAPATPTAPPAQDPEATEPAGPQGTDTATPGEEPPADPPQEPSAPTPEGDDPMSTRATDPQPGAPGAAPGAQPTGTPPAAPATPPVSPDPNHASLAASRAALDRELRLARESRERTQALETEARQERATHRVDRDLEALGGRITPAERNHLRPVLLSLAQAETPRTVHLAARTAEDPDATREVTEYEALLACYQARPDTLATLARELAGEDADPPATADPRPRDVRQFHLASGVTDERLQELVGRYGRDVIFGTPGAN